MRRREIDGRRHWPIRAYLALLLVVFVAAALVAVVHVKIQTADDARTGATADTSHSAKTAATQLGGFIALLKASVASLAANPQIEQTLVNPTGCTLTFSGIGGADASHLDVIGPDGRVACTSRAKSIEDHVRYPTAGWLRQARRGPVFLAPVTDAATGKQVAIAARPTLKGEAVIAGFVDLGTVGPDLADLYGGGKPVVFLVAAADGTIVARSTSPGRFIGRSLADTSLGTMRGGAEKLRDLDGTSRFYARSSVPGTGWRFYAGESASAVLADGRRLEHRQLLIIGIGLLVSLLGAWFVQRRLVRPIQQFGDALGSTSGRPRPEPVPLHGPSEIAELGQHVNTLIDAVNSELLERERAEAAIVESERKYRLLFESNPNPMWVYDRETLWFLAVNDAATAAYGYTREEFLGMTIEDIRPAGDVEAVRDEADGSRGLSHAGVWRHLRKDGTHLDVQITSNDHDFAGRPARVVLATDITEQLRAERRLRVSETRYRDLFENANDLIATVDLDGRLTAVNRRFAERLGYAADELLGRPLLDVVPPEWHAELTEAREAKYGGSDAATVYEHELLARDGQRIPVEVSSRVITQDGTPVGIQAICRDITERRTLEEQLRQAQRLEAIGRLAGGIAHDFNNLLTVISGYAEALLEDRPGEGGSELREIAAAADRATALTRQLLAFSRRQVLRPRALSLNSVIEGVTPMLGRLIGEDVELQASLDPQVRPVHADPSQLEQVLLNLAVNARDAMPEGGHLTIETSSVYLDADYVAHHTQATEGPHTALAVTDSGIGMDAGTMARIFEPFFTTKPVGEGTGLGLASVYGIVKQSGGSIWVYSELGHGTTFKVYLPVAVDPVDAGAAPEEPAAPTGTETILVVEDEPALRALVSQMLESKGYMVVTAESAEDALELARSDLIDLVLTDLVMPRISGRELAARIRETRPNARVLFMSGYADEAVVRHGALDAGAAFVEKPFSANELARSVREALDRPAHVLV
jgi:two-component system, cell cycle sensor histidine kinase and response regulator CckA